MSSVQYTYPKLRLTAQLRKAGGLPVVEALAAADANLAELRSEGLQALQAAARAAVECFAGFPAAFDADRLHALYAIAARAVGSGTISGAPAADKALSSLCQLIDHLLTSTRWDKPAIEVHVQTLQLLAVGAERAFDAETMDNLLSGLEKVNARHAAEAPQP